MTRPARWALHPYGMCVAILLLAVISTSAQNAVGTILGIVKDTSGGVVAGATVTVTNTDTGTVRTGTTEADGSYTFPALLVGNYAVKVVKDGFQTADRNGITLVVAQEAAIDITLQVGSTGQTITVTEEAPVVNTTTSMIAGTVEEQKIADLPLNGRDYVDLTLMQAGITQSTLTAVGTIQALGVTGVTYTANGAPLHSNLTTLDGAILSTVDGLNATSVLGTTLGVDGIREFKVVTSTYEAEYGLVSGGQTQMVSKSGTNDWHGDVFEYLRNSAMDARNYFDTLDTTNFNGCGTNKSLPYPCKRIPPFTRNDFGASAGGPIRKDKTFVYGVYEGLRTSIAPPIGTNLASSGLNPGCYYGSSTSPTGPFTHFNTGLPEYIDNDPTTNPYSVFITGVNTACFKPTTSSLTNNLPNTLIILGCPVTALTGTATATTGCAGPVPAGYPAFNPTFNPELGGADYLPAPNTGYGKNAAGQTVQVLPYNYTFPFKNIQAENYYQLRMDQVFSASDSAFFRYTADLANQNAPESLPIMKDEYKSEALFATVSETHVFSPTVLNTARISYSRTGLNLTDVSDPFLANNVLVPGQDIGCCVVVPGASTPGDIYQNILTMSDDVYWTKGKHAFKFGTLINHFDDLIDLGFQTRGSVTFSSGIQGYAEGFYTAMAVTPVFNTSPIGVGYGNVRIYYYNTWGFYAADDYRVLPRLTLNLGFRYEFATTATAPPGMSYAVVNPLTSTQGTPNPPFIDPSKHAFSPRIGFAWDIFGDGKTALRGAAGIYYDVGNNGGLFATNQSAGPPLTMTEGYSNSVNAPPIPFTYGQYGTYPLLNPAINTAILNPRNAEFYMKQPSVGQWNLTIDRQLPAGFGLTVAYVGNQAWHELQLTSSNPVTPVGTLPNGLPIFGCYQNNSLGYELPGAPYYIAGSAAAITAGAKTGACPTGFAQTGPTANQNCVRNGAPGPCWGTFLLSTAGGNSTYNSLQVGLNRRLSHGLQMQLNYTYAHALDDGVKTILDPDSTNSNQAPQDRALDKGNSFNDIRHNIRANVIYHIPNNTSDKFYMKALNGWWVGSIISWQTGYPITITNGDARNLQGSVDTIDRPNLDPSFNPNTAVTGNPAGWINPTMFDTQTAGTFGNAGKGIVRGPKLTNEDFSINKDTRLKWLGEQGSVEFRAEIFNIYNHPNFLAPSGAIPLAVAPAGGTAQTLAVGQYGIAGTPLATTPTAFAITSTVNKSRQVQLALKIVF